jgi:hypothetical protein
MGWDLEEAFRRVHASNMPKLCSTEQEAEDTVTAYEKSREDGTSTYDSPAYRYHEALQKWVVYNQSTGKILKSILYHPVELGDLV